MQRRNTRLKSRFVASHLITVISDSMVVTALVRGIYLILYLKIREVDGSSCSTYPLVAVKVDFGEARSSALVAHESLSSTRCQGGGLFVLPSFPLTGSLSFHIKFHFFNPGVWINACCNH